MAVGSSSGQKNKGIRQSSTYPKAPKGYAIRHGVQRGSYNGLNDEKPVATAVPLDSQSLDEGLYTLAQTGSCRREVLTAIYGNKPPRPTAPCCDLCDPTLLDRTRPGPHESAPRNTAVKTGILDKRVKLALGVWRTKIYKRDFDGAIFSPSGILPEEKIDLLSSVGTIDSRDRLEVVVGKDWMWFSTYGDELLKELTKLEIGPMQPNNSRARADKRPAELNDKGISEKGPKTKKTRTSLPAEVPSFPTRFENPTPVIAAATPSTSQIPRFPSVFPHYGSMAMSSSPIPPSLSTPMHHTPYYHPTPTQIPYNPYSHMLQPTYHMPPPGYAYYQTPTRPLGYQNVTGTFYHTNPGHGTQTDGSNTQDKQ